MKKIISILSCLCLSWLFLYGIWAYNAPTTNIIYLHEHVQAGQSAQEVLKELSSTGNVILKFYADWCGPCRRMTPLLDSVATAMPSFTFIYIDRDKFPDLAKSFYVTSIPTLVFLRNGRIIGSYDGKPLSQNELNHLIISMFRNN